MFAVFNFIAKVAVVFLKGFVISKLWGWFAVPLGMLPIETFTAVGFYLILCIVPGDVTATFRNQKALKEEYEDGLDVINFGITLISAVTALGSLALGALISRVM